MCTEMPTSQQIVGNCYGSVIICNMETAVKPQNVPLFTKEKINTTEN
jgi:hypothetical protein